MPLKYEEARYNCVSTRMSQAELQRLDKLRGKRSRADVMYEAVLGWMRRCES
jgi:hypothetical protein